MVYLSLILLFMLCTLINFSKARLAVKTPNSLWEQFDKINGIDHVVLTPQNKITYKRSFIGNLVLADPEDGCDSIRSLNTFSNMAINNPILLVDWGECHYPQKVKNAEIAGAKMVILVLRNDMPMNHPVIKQMPLDTTLEVLAVSKTDGNILMSFLKESETKEVNNPHNVVELTYSYDIERHINYVKGNTTIIDFWFTVTDRTGQTYQFLEDFSSILRKFGDKIEFHPHYVLWQCEECAAQKRAKGSPRCISSGLYCDPEPFTESKLSGSLSVIETLRQISFRELANKVTVDDDWWRYTINFGKKCVNLDTRYIFGCRIEVLKALDISGETLIDIEMMMKKSFTYEPLGMNPENLYMDNTNLQNEIQLQEEMHVDHYPALYVNKERYIGNFRNIKGIEEFICSSLITPPSFCVKTAPKVNADTTTAADSVLYVTIILISIITMAVILYCVRRSVRRQVMGRMNDEISHIVTQYKQFKDKSNSLGDEDT